jgi:hypothetical protein
MTTPSVLPTTLRCPEDTGGWVLTKVAGQEAWTDELGVTWVRASESETPEIVVVFTRHPGLQPRGLVRADASRSVRRAQRKARREARALKVRGYASNS